MTPRRVTTVDADADPEVYPLAFGVEVTAGTATDEAPAEVRITVTNRGPDLVEVCTGWPGVFGGPKSEERDPGLVLVPPGSPPGKAESPGGRPASFAIPAVLRCLELDPGASESTTLAVSSQDPADTPGRLPEGTFAFRASYTVSPADGAGEASFDWGFSLDVESTA